MSDHYSTLGVEKNASQSDIKKAFYRLAGEHHPDKPNGNEAKFKEINNAYQTLSDETKRAQYDRFGDAGQSFGGGQSGGGNPFGGFDFSGFGQGGFDFGGDNADMNDILSQMFGGGRRTPRGRTVQTRAQLTFAQSVYGCDKEIDVPNYVDGRQDGNRKLSVKIPGGVENGMTLEMPDQGEQLTNGKNGTLHIIISVESDKTFGRDGANLIIHKSVKLTEAILGSSFDIVLPDSKKLSVDIPAGLAIGQILRVRGRGCVTQRGTGDLMIVTEIQIPKKLSKEGKKAIELLQKEGL
jgi:molecular chaperone DnaJ